MDKFKCCLCGKEVEEWGNDPWPVDMHPDHKCCDECNATKVIPARLQQMKERRKKNEGI